MDSNILWTLAVSYILFFLVSFIAWKKESISLTGKSRRIHSLTGISIKNIAGIIILGLPLILSHINWSNLFALPSFDSLEQILIFFSLVLIAGGTALQSGFKKSKAYRMHKKRADLVPTSSIIGYLLIRICFLVIYECLFRGLLLSVCISVCGVYGAIVINLFLYSILHAFNGRSEMIVCIPFGLVLCGITIWYQSIIPAMALHLVLAATCEIYLLCTPILSPQILRL